MAIAEDITQYLTAERGIDPYLVPSSVFLISVTVDMTNDESRSDIFGLNRHFRLSRTDTIQPHRYQCVAEPLE